MARPKIRTALVRITRSFGHVHAGDEIELEITPTVEGWFAAGVAKEVTSGPSKAGPREPEPNAHERVADGAEDSRPSGREQGPGFGSGAYGAVEGLD